MRECVGGEPVILGSRGPGQYGLYLIDDVGEGLLAHSGADILEPVHRQSLLATDNLPVVRAQREAVDVTIPRRGVVARLLLHLRLPDQTQRLVALAPPLDRAPGAEATADQDHYRESDPVAEDDSHPAWLRESIDGGHDFRRYIARRSKDYYSAQIGRHRSRVGRTHHHRQDAAGGRAPFLFGKLEFGQ